MYILFSVVTSLKYCRYDVKLYPNNQSINHPMLFDQAKKFGIRQKRSLQIYISRVAPPPLLPPTKKQPNAYFQILLKTPYICLFNKHTMIIDTGNSALSHNGRELFIDGCNHVPGKGGVDFVTGSVHVGNGAIGGIHGLHVNLVT